MDNDAEQAVKQITDRAANGVWDRFVANINEDNLLSDEDLMNKFLSIERRNCLLDIVRYNIRRACCATEIAPHIGSRDQESIEKVTQLTSQMHSTERVIAAAELKLQSILKLERENLASEVIQKNYGDSHNAESVSAPASEEGVSPETEHQAEPVSDVPAALAD